MCSEAVTNPQNRQHQRPRSRVNMSENRKEWSLFSFALCQETLSFPAWPEGPQTESERRCIFPWLSLRAGEVMEVLGQTANDSKQRCAEPSTKAASAHVPRPGCASNGPTARPPPWALRCCGCKKSPNIVTLSFASFCKATGPCVHTWQGSFRRLFPEARPPVCWPRCSGLQLRRRRHVESTTLPGNAHARFMDHMLESRDQRLQLSGLRVLRVDEFGL